MRAFALTFDQMAGLALRSVAEATGRPVGDLTPFRLELLTPEGSEPSFVVTVNADRDPVPAAEFEPGGF